MTESTNPVLIMLIGYPAAGKSTLRRALIEQRPDRDYVVVSTDDIVEELAAEHGVPYNVAFNKFFKTANIEMMRRAREAVAAKRNIIWDQTNLVKSSRRKKLSIVPDDYDIFYEMLVVEPSVIYERNANRPDGRGIDRKIVEGMIKSFEWPTLDEGYEWLNVHY